MIETNTDFSLSVLRRVAEIDLGDGEPNEPHSGPPIIEWVDPRSLYVDESYQREISPRGVKLIRMIATGWDWSKFKPPICALGEHDGAAVLVVNDGQHTAIGAACNPWVDQIPVVVVETPDIKTKALSFIGHNVNRIAVTNLQLHHAALAASDERAQTVQQVCDRAGVKILKQPPGDGVYEVGETLAVKGIYGLVERRFAIGARKVLEVLVQGECAPVSIAQIKAVEFLMNDPDHAGKIEPDDLVDTIRGGYAVDFDEARRLSVSHKTAVWRALVMVWFKKCKKRRKAVAGLES